ncbi:phosphatidylethanolamine-binding protein [Pseudomassariella vexata]|uniref:Phosphatidylethanolamine-binding protein n=1 Tax=Pseudomassariella vexata TaxID=1141098 RepID=A0A1Y2DHK4_9PEZI|nr:phosphatidylethanolamine-binding protein [Pseudomassariella vexata]ORY58708.1 phosphatidylethanolamine-binding protein [Pseudomassariella vexata]
MAAFSLSAILFAHGLVAVATLQVRPAEQNVLASSETFSSTSAYKVQHEYPFRPGSLKTAQLKLTLLSRLKKAEIIPTVIDEFFPSFILDASWSSDDYASLGNTLKVKKIQKKPKILLSQDPSTSTTLCNPNVTYAVTLTDPDAPSRDNPKWAEMCHFIASGFATTLSSDDSCSSLELTNLTDIMPYKAPGPPPKTGKHRYVFLVFAPANSTTSPLNLTKPEDRQHWGTGKQRHGVRDWAHENDLVPVAANFVYAQNKKQ